ncbi:ABC transporter permease [Protaetiibacter mangrovi]|uniref:FtsX-like permease family protein n=1 Tax=Protaetiibacter mangrovi TaxID=2970926 RepID=A0ABT1ZF08_9MICO|nr:FtsX-like permease family protein [Protaetiibacter mangrovi]MCS0499264.1 FtsX-like permease family protein [Protaetiibacter mangrovi]TPW92209.1 FtsX-like permease family protein [Schumannella luteola]
MSGAGPASGVREHGSSILVALLSSAFGVALLQITGVLDDAIRADPITGRSTTVGIMLTVIAWVFIAIAIYVGSIVTANTFATIVAGRARSIALLRLIGSSARRQRRAVAREGLVVGLIGAVAGAAVGTGLAVALERLAVWADWLPEVAHDWADPGLAAPILAVVATTWLAAWVGSRRVLTVTPLQAIGGSQPLSLEEARSRPARNAIAITLFAVGTATLVLSMLLGLVTPFAVLIGVVGGILSFTGVVLGAHLIMPPALRLVGRMLGRSPSARLAAANALRYPERSSRTTIGVVIGVTLVTMFGVTVASFRLLIEAAQAEQPEVYEGTGAMLDGVTAVFSVLIGVSALIAAVGLVNALSLSVLQRTRELGLLRALGFSRAQLRRMILAESVQLTATAVLVGLVLGTFYGWAGAQSLLGSASGMPGIVAPGVPWTILAIVVVSAAVLTVAATITPARRATRVSPITALAVE